MQTTISGLILLPIFALTLFYVMRYKVSKSLSPGLRQELCVNGKNHSVG